MSELARQAPALARHLVALSRREALLLNQALAGAAPHTCMPAPAVRRRLRALREPETLDACLDATERADAPARRHLRDHLARQLEPGPPRAAPIHDSWIEAALKQVPDGLRDDADTWLRAPASAMRDATASTARRALRRWCVSRFPCGPTHLLDQARPTELHLGHACLLDADELLGVADTLGLHALKVGLSDADSRRAAATTAALPDPLRERFVELPPVQTARALRLRLQAAMVELRRRSGAELETLTRALGLRILTLAAATRFELELRFLAVRLPEVHGAPLAADHAATLRLPLEIAHDARRLLARVLREHVETSP